MRQGKADSIRSRLLVVGWVALAVAIGSGSEARAFTQTVSGWVCVDSEETTGSPPQFSWDDIAFQGQGVGAGCCDSAVTFFGAGQPPWPAGVMGTVGAQLTVGSNGYCQFPAAGFGAQFLNDNGPIPSPQAPTNGLCGYWDNLLPVDAQNAIRLAILGAAPDRRMVLGWQNVAHANGAAAAVVSFQMTLFEQGNAVRFQYQSMIGPLANGSGATVGINNFNGTLGFQYVNNGVPATNNIYNNLAIGFYLQGTTPPWPIIPPPPAPPSGGPGSASVDDGNKSGEFKDDWDEFRHAACGAGSSAAGLFLGVACGLILLGSLARRS